MARPMRDSHGGVAAAGPSAPATAVSMTAAELERIRRTASIQTSVMAQKSVEDEREAAALDARREASAVRSARFPNTLAAMRKRKLAAREAKLMEEENARLKLDVEEENLRQQERLRVLEGAHRSLIESTDRMKMLRSQKLASHIVDVRTRQADLAARKRALEKEFAAEDHAEMLDRIREGEARDQAAAAARSERRIATAVEQKVQLREVLTRKVHEVEEYKAEGRRIAEVAAANAAEEEAERRRRKEAVMQSNREMTEANTALQRMKVEAGVAAEAEAERLAAYAAQKQREAEAKAAIIAAKHAEATRKAKLIAEKNERDFSARMHNESERVEAAVAEATAKADALEQHKRQRQQQMRADIESHRQTQARRAEAEAADAARAAAAQASRFAANIGALEGLEAADAAERRTRARFLQQYHLAQMADKKRGFEGAAAEGRALATDAGAAAAGRSSSAFTLAFAAAADALLAEERGKGHATLGLQRAIARSQKDPLIAATALM